MRRRFLCIALFILTLTGCSSEPDKSAAPQGSGAKSSTRMISKDGLTIQLSAEEAKRFEVQQVSLQKVKILIQAPARTLAGFVESSGLQKPIVIYETQELAQIYAEYTKDKAKFERTEIQVARLQEMQKNDAASSKDVIDAQTENIQAEAELREAESRLRQNGINPSLFDRMPAGSVLITADIPESKIKSVSVGEKAKLTFYSYPNDPFDATVVSIGDVIDPQTRMIHVQLRTQNRQGQLKPGMFATVSIEEKETDAFVLPSAAIVSVEGKNFVFVATDNNTFVRREVASGDVSGKNIQIFSGLKEGERVVVNNAILLKGMSFGY